MSSSRRSLEERLTALLKPRLGQSGPWPREVYRHVERRAEERGQTAEAFLERIELRKHDFADLIAAATVGHTSFFRHPDHFTQLRKGAEAAAARTGRVRVWSAACSTGEEVWSIALCLKDAGVPFQIWASDVNPRAVDIARTAIYPARATTGLPGSDGKVPWRAPLELRSQVRFFTAALADALPSDAPDSFDFIFCRNVMIYFTPESIQQNWRKLLSRLAPWGAIAVAPVESLSHVPSEIVRAGPLGWMRWRSQPSAFSAETTQITRQISARVSERPTEADVVDKSLERIARLLSAGELDAAETALHGLLALRDDVVGWFLLGETCARRGEKTQARIAFERATRAPHAPKDVDLETMQDAARRRAQQLPLGK
jgi:chemotaxis protein methyltransferase CheR